VIVGLVTEVSRLASDISSIRGGRLTLVASVHLDSASERVLIGWDPP